jgi:hypothetical protein
VLANLPIVKTEKQKFEIRKEGQKYSKWRGGGSGGVPFIESGSDTYTAKAVHFDGATWLVNPSLVATDNNLFSFMYWFKNNGSPPYPDDGWLMNAGLPFVVDSENNYSTYVDNLLSGSSIRISMENEAGALGVNTDINPPPNDANWHQLLFTGQTGQISGSNTRKVFLDGVDATTLGNDQGPFDMVFNGKSFWFGSDSFGGGLGSAIIGDIADAWIAPGISLLTAGTISADTLALFRDPVTGKPKNPSGFPAGGAVLFSGDADTFATNQLTGGTFTLTGALTNASTSPSD